MLANAPPAQQIYLTTVLSEAKDNWTPAEKDKYFKLFPSILGSKGGNSFTGYINSARKMALANLPEAQFAHYDSLSGSALLNGSGKHLAEDVAGAKGPGRDWKVADALSEVENKLMNRNFEQGRAMFKVSLCAACHSIKGEGGSIGPDLTQLVTRFSDKDILESIIEPDKAISDQYSATIFQLKDGSSVMGRLMRDDAEKYYVLQNPFAPLTLRELLKKDVTSNKISNVSIMLPGLINRLNPEELKDLMAYLKAGGDKENKLYKGKSE
jgi:putative heme-binding domain-containing protein